MKADFPPLDTLLNGETLTIEYKEDLDIRHKRAPMDSGTLAGSLMALGNAQGGYLLLGVTNASQITGIHAQRSALNTLRSEIARRFTVTPEITSHAYHAEEKVVWAFHVEPAVQNPLQLTDGTLRIRRHDGKKQGPENLPFFIAEIPAWQAQRGTHYDFSSAQIPDLTWSNRESWLSILALERFEVRLKSGRINNPVLATLPTHEARFDAMGILGRDGSAKVATNAALILFGRNEVLDERLPGHDAQFQKFDNSGVISPNLFLGRPGLEQRCLLLLSERLEELYRGLVDRRELMDGLFRIDVPDYGDDALREATMNAFIHRDYKMNGAVIIQLHPQRFIITNPGGFFRDVTSENVLFHEPCPRNRCLAQACADLALVEKSGRGVDRIFWDQIRFFRPLPSYAASNTEAVRLTLEGGQSSLDTIRWMAHHFENIHDLTLQLIHGAFLHRLFFDGETSRQELLCSLPGLNPDQGLRAITEMISAGIITRIGHGRGQRLILSHQLQQEMGCPEAFVHQAGLADEQRRQMILTYVDTYGRITRAQAAKLLRMPPGDSVYSLLRSLTQSEELIMRGKLRYAFYERPG